MNDACCLGTLLAIGIYMAHHIMTDFLFSRLGHIIIDILCMGLELVNLLLGNDRLAIL